MEPNHDSEVAEQQHTISQKEFSTHENSSDSSSIASSMDSEYRRYCDTTAIDVDIANTHKSNKELEGEDVDQFFATAKNIDMRGRSRANSYEWIGSLPRTMTEKALPLFTDDNTRTDYQLHFCSTWMNAFRTTYAQEYGMPNSLINRLVNYSKDKGAELMRKPMSIIPIGKLFVNISGRSNWTGYEVVVDNQLSLWIIYVVDKIDPEKSYPVECSLLRCTLPGIEDNEQIQSKTIPNFKVARLWDSIITLESAKFETAVKNIKAAHMTGSTGSLYIWKWPMHFASFSSGDVDFATRRFQVRPQSCAGKELLLLACENVDKCILMPTKANINAEPQDRGLLFLAVENSDELIIELLVSTGKANLEMKDEYKLNRTPLSLAAQYSSVAVIKQLLRAKAKVESNDDQKETPLSHAVKWGNEAAVEPLLNAKADVESKNKSGQTPLSLAACGGFRDAVKQLLGAGADTESRDEMGRTPLWHAVRHCRSGTISLLLEANAKIESRDELGQTALSCAALWGNEVVVKMLLERGANPNSEDKTGRKPLEYAVEGRKAAIVALLKPLTSPSSPSTTA